MDTFLPGNGYLRLNSKQHVEDLIKNFRDQHRIKRKHEKGIELRIDANDMADKIRNPLNVILLHSSLLKRTCEVNEANSRHLTIIQEEAHRLNQFVCRLLGDTHDEKQISIKGPLQRCA